MCGRLKLFARCPDTRHTQVSESIHHYLVLVMDKPFYVSEDKRTTDQRKWNCMCMLHECNCFLAKCVCFIDYSQAQ